MKLNKKAIISSFFFLSCCSHNRVSIVINCPDLLLANEQRSLSYSFNFTINMFMSATSKYPAEVNKKI